MIKRSRKACFNFALVLGILFVQSAARANDSSTTLDIYCIDISASVESAT